MFINLLNIKEYISFIVDDDPNKNSLKIPPSMVEIKKSEAINWKEIGVCIFAISISAEKKVKKLLSKKINKEIQYFSISPDSVYALPIFNSIKL